MMKIALCVVLFSISYALSSAQQTPHVSPAGTNFLIYTPPSYATSADEFPLLISLHGKGEWGTDLTKLTSGNPTGMPSRLIHLNQWPKNYDFIVVTPQYNPPDVDDPNPIWPASHIDEVVNFVFANWRIKKDRVYVTGLSLGANATWNYAAAYPEKVAAIVPIGGRADYTKACLLKDIPAWVFHGDGDETVTPAYSRDMVQAIDNCAPKGRFNRKFNLLYTKNHDGWNEIYNGSGGYNIYDWLLTHSKGSSANPWPYVNAGPDISVRADAGQVTLVGDAFDSNGSITGVNWVQTSGVSLHLANANSSEVTISNLQAGSYEFEFSSTDNDGARTADRMIMNVVGSSSLPVVSDLMLIDGASNKDLLELTNGVVIDKELLGTDQFNIRAHASENTQSVRFSVNTFRNARTVSRPGPYLIKTPRAALPEWQIEPGEYVICATPFSETGGRGDRGISKCVRIRVIEGVPGAGCEGPGMIFREVWPGVDGSAVADIPLGTTPSIVSPLYSFEAPTSEKGAGDNYGARIRGYICPAATGKYTFWIASDDGSELWLSTDDSPLSKVRIAYVSEYTNPREWTKYASQRSGEISLVAGKRYYIEALHKEADMNDHLSVGWQLPDGTLQRPIPATRLIPYSEGGSEEPTGEDEEPSDEDEEPSGEDEEPSDEDEDPAEDPDEEIPDPVEDPVDDVEIFPNPVRSIHTKITLHGFARQGARPVKAIIISPTGQVVKTVSLNCLDNCDRIEVDMDSPLPAGVYSIQVFTESGRVPKRFMVQ